MKKLLIAMLCLGMSLGITACSGKNSESAKTEEVKEELSFDTIKQALKDNGYTIKEETKAAAEMIGAQEGYKYTTDKDETYEFYKFDPSSDEYKKAEKDGVVTLEGFGDFKVVTNNGYAMFSDNVNDDLIKLFKSL